MSAFSLGMVQRDGIARRIARNETLAHTGNVIFAALAGLLGELLKLRDVFLMAAVFSTG